MEIENLIIHCAFTPKNMFVGVDELEHWHKAPRRNKDETITYLGKKYKCLSDVPLREIHKGKWGNGWDRFGYWQIIHQSGDKTILTPINDDNYITQDEMTWGAAGINSKSIHMCLEGGFLANGRKPNGLVKPEDLYSDQQLAVAIYEVRDFLSKHPNVKVSGHNRHSRKTCPGFNVAKWLENNGLGDYVLK